MQPKVSIISKVVNGKLDRNRSKITKVIESFEGKEIEITIEKKRKKRSLNQNNYYFGVIIALFKEAIFDQFGEYWDSARVHEYLKNEFLFHEHMVGDKIFKTPKSTTECSTVETEEYYEKCRRFALEDFNCVIPLPSEEMTLKFEN